MFVQREVVIIRLTLTRKMILCSLRDFLRFSKNCQRSSWIRIFQSRLNNELKKSYNKILNIMRISWRAEQASLLIHAYFMAILQVSKNKFFAWFLIEVLCSIIGRYFTFCSHKFLPKIIERDLWLFLLGKVSWSHVT